ncbi:hypothetical protein MBLNU459_g3680t1 [Dothideomycetes sp. NU459]
MAWFSRLNPTPGFPSYSGPYSVGTVDVEIPTADIPACSTTPESTPSTIAYRIFYPCESESPSSRPVRWIPSPQRQYVSAAAKFFGAGSKFAELFSWAPLLLTSISIPAQRNAPILSPPTRNKRWPVMFFSHGLAGSRNMYSHMCGTLSSHGLVVIALDHRDGSSPIQYVRATQDTEAHTVQPVSLPHEPSPAVYEGRDKQLRTRMWEIAQAHTTVLKIDRGEKVNNIDENTSYRRKERVEVLSRFADMLDVHEPGRISFAGHSFGACTTIQFVKSIFYASEKPASARDVLFEPHQGSDLTKQITTDNPVALLDLWCLPLRSPNQSWLWERPLPSYQTAGPGGQAVVSILSQGFYKWSGNFNDVKRAIDPPKNYHGPNPHIFYPANSQHFSQSDVGILFPYLTARFAKAQEPERVLKLNARAILQMLRQSGIDITGTSAADRELLNEPADEKDQDLAILATDGSVRGWIAIPLENNAVNGGITIEQDKKKSPNDEVNGESALDM